jgi:hypothetical protein
MCIVLERGQHRGQVTGTTDIACQAKDYAGLDWDEQLASLAHVGEITLPPMGTSWLQGLSAPRNRRDGGAILRQLQGQVCAAKLPLP